MNILKIEHPFDLFDIENFESSFRELAKKYHPDITGKNDEFVHIKNLYDLAKKQINQKVFITEKFLFVDKKKFEIKEKFDFSYGTLITTQKNAIYLFDKNKDLLKNNFKNFSFSSDKMKEQFNQLLPIYQKTEFFESHSIQFIKNENFIPLAKIIQYNIPEETSIWILNRLYSIANYLKYLNIVHLDISKHTVFVNLENHTVSLLGGWYYVVKLNDIIKSMPLETYKQLPNSIISSKIASEKIMSIQIKNLILSFFDKRKINNYFKDWLTKPSEENIFIEYKKWDTEILQKIFPVTINDQEVEREELDYSYISNGETYKNIIKV